MNPGKIYLYLWVVASIIYDCWRPPVVMILEVTMQCYSNVPFNILFFLCTNRKLVKIKHFRSIVCTSESN